MSVGVITFHIVNATDEARQHPDHGRQLEIKHSGGINIVSRARVRAALAVGHYQLYNCSFILQMITVKN